eukprot:1454005-Amphidinium_carterae.1
MHNQVVINSNSLWLNVSRKQADCDFIAGAGLSWERIGQNGGRKQRMSHVKALRIEVCWTTPRYSL